jgi:hypothetical protein
MAAATVTAGPRTVVTGNMREWLYTVNIAADADYLDVPLRKVLGVHLNDSAVSAIGVAGVTLVGGKSRIEFNSGGALTGIYVRAIGW